MKCNEASPELAVGTALLETMETEQYRLTLDPMIAWRGVAALIKGEANEDRCAQLVQAVSTCIITGVRPGTWKG